MAKKNKFNAPKIPNAVTVTANSSNPKAPKTPKYYVGNANKKDTLNIFYVILIWLYAWFAFIPHLNAWDTNATHFMLLSFFNLAVYSYMFSTDTFKNSTFFRWVFFKNPAGMSYGVYILIMFLSLSKVINFGEAIITTSKYFSTFTTAIILTMLISLDKRYLIHLAQAMTSVLIWDVIVLLKYLNQLIQGATTVYEFKSNYSNKNIYSTAILVKTPFAVWLYLRDNSIWKKIGLIVSFGAFYSIWVISTRTSYLGVIFLFVLLIGYIVFAQIKSKRSNWKHFIKTIAPVIIAIIGSIGLYAIVRNLFYIDKQSNYTNTIASRFSTISVDNNAKDASIDLRFTSWSNSFKLFKDEPILGAGVGNWKIKVLKYENEKNGSFTYMYKAHNDFIETFTELGVFGGLAFLGIFLMIIYNFFKNYKPEGDDADEELQFDNSALFLGLLGIGVYSTDAFFNFPADRPPMQIVFASFISVSIAYSMFDFKKNLGNLDTQKNNSFAIGKYITYIIIAYASVGSWVLWINYKSSKIQWKIAQDSAQPRQQLTGEYLSKAIPAIPDITVVEEPMAVVKGRYFINENKFKEALNVLTKDKSSPYDGRPQYLSAFCYFRLNMIDSALYYCKKSKEVKPLFWGPVALMSDIYVSKNDLTSAFKVAQDFVKRNKTERAAWQNLASLYERKRNKEGAIAMIDSAIKHTGADSSLLDIKYKLENKKVGAYNPNRPAFQLAADAYNQKKYAEAARYFSQFLLTEKDINNINKAREFRGYSYFYLKNFAKASIDFEFVKRTIKDNVNLNVMHTMCLSNLGKGSNKQGFDFSKLQNGANGQQQITPEMMKALEKAQKEQREKEWNEKQKEYDAQRKEMTPDKIEALKRAQQERQKELEKNN